MHLVYVGCYQFVRIRVLVVLRYTSALGLEWPKGTPGNPVERVKPSSLAQEKPEVTRDE